MSNALKYLFLTLLTIPLAMSEAHALRFIWEVACASTYGPGPSLAAWYAGATVLQLIVSPLAFGAARDEKEADIPWFSKRLTYSITYAALCWMTALTVWGVVALLGWA